MRLSMLFRPQPTADHATIATCSVEECALLPNASSMSSPESGALLESVRRVHHLILVPYRVPEIVRLVGVVIGSAAPPDPRVIRRQRRHEQTNRCIDHDPGPAPAPVPVASPPIPVAPVKIVAFARTAYELTDTACRWRAHDVAPVVVIAVVPKAQVEVLVCSRAELAAATAAATTIGPGVWS